jgi:hypothetical protein
MLKKPTNNVIGHIMVEVREDDYTVSVSGDLSMETVWGVAQGIVEYLEDVVKELDNNPPTMLQ